MEQFIGCDARKRCSVFVAVGEDGGCSPAWKVSHTDGALEAFLEELPEGSEIALEACSSCYWMVAAANLVAVNQQRLGPCHVLELYQRLKKRKPAGSRKRPGWRFRPRTGKRKQALTHRGRAVNATPVSPKFRFASDAISLI
jgi:hypothetical protein